jgi:hypothetical protein
MAELGKAYIEVRADLSKFPAELRTKLAAALKEGTAGVNFDGLEQKAKAAGEKAGDAAGSGFSRKLKRKVESDAAGGFLGGLKALGKIFDREKDSKGGLFSSVEKLFSSAAEEGLKGGAEKLGQVFKVGSELGSAIGGIGGQIGSIIQFAAIAILIPIIIQLAGAVVQLGAAIFALPAAIGVAAAAFIPLIIAFQGFGEAVGAGLSGDVDKFNEALKGLPPSMRSVVKEVVGLKSVFTGVKTSIQEAFFKPLVGVVGPALRSIITTVVPGLTRIAGSLGNVGASLLKTFSAPENLRTFNDLLASTNRVVQTMEPALSNLAQALLNLIRPALPFIERGATAFRDFAGRIESFTRRIGSDGTLSGWLDKAAHILGTIISLTKEFGTYLITILGGEIGDIGSNFLDEFLEKLKQIVAFIKSPDGQQTIHNLGVVLKFVGDIFIFLIGLYPTMARGLNLAFDAVRLLLKGLQALGGGFVWLIQKIGEFAVWLGTGIGHGFAVAYRAVVGWVSSAGSAIADFFTKDIPRWFGEAVDWFRALPGRIVDAISSFREAGRNFIVDTLKSWYSSVFEQIGRLIGLFLALPYLIQTGWQKSISFIGDFFTSAWQFAVNAFWTGVTAIGDAINAIPGLLSAAGSAIGDFFTNLGSSIWSFLTETLPAALGTAMSAIGDFFVSLWNNVFVAAGQAIADGFNAVVDFIGSLPGRIRALGPMIYNAAVELGRQLAHGLSSIGNFATDIGNKVASALKTAINWVIGKINDGIADIDNQLPVSLPRIPRLAKGAVVDSPTLALIGEAGREVVMPLNDPARAQALAEQSGLFDVLRRGGSEQQAPVVHLTAVLDGFGVLRVVDMRINEALDQQGSEVANGVRS